MPSSSLHRQLAINLFLLLGSVYFLTSSGNTVDVTDDAMLRFAVTERLVEKGTFDLPGDLGRRFGVLGPDGSYYTNHGIGQSVLAVPFYWAGKLLGNSKFLVSMMGPVACGLTCVVLLRLGLRLGYSTRTAVRLALIAGLCTQLWPESKSPFDHSLETLFTLLSLLLVFAGSREDRNQLFVLAGGCLGLAVLTRVTAILWALPLLVFFWFPDEDMQRTLKRSQLLTRAVAFAAGLVPFLALILWYNSARFGSVFEAGYNQWARDRNVDNFSNALWLGLLGETVSPGKGVLLYSPVLALAIIGAPAFLRWRRRTAVFCGAATALYLVFFGKYIAWHGDVAWGPRYLTFLMPLWLLCLGVFWNRKLSRKLGPRLVMGTLIGMSFMLQLAGVIVDMNLHYHRLLRSGVIQNVNSYSFPAKIYFDRQYSPLCSRWTEIRALFDRGNLPALDVETSDRWAPSLDFWWVRNLTEETSRATVILVGPFFFEIIISGLRIRRLLRRTAPDGVDAIVP
ncbi:MAG: glycosyltransferase family 39 protein [Acidobacteria bacterium]|nr:glycosyltransferase family 39 protein [Acidobacteriota bacterium]MCI0718495.1 glycosyltransferase family 39 protein [Acidobacteriota bacterium]